jgi:hypothetical protein
MASPAPILGGGEIVEPARVRCGKKSEKRLFLHKKSTKEDIRNWAPRFMMVLPAPVFERR